MNGDNNNFIIETENVGYVYQPQTPFEKTALEGINIKIKKGEKVGILGPTGSGKSTLVQLFNGLLTPTSGSVLIEGEDINRPSKKPAKKSPSVESPVTPRVGLVFQYPEYQIFEETVFEDVAFGPKNMGLSVDEIKSRVENALKWVDMDFDKIKDRSPFSLSGGEMRKVALAGVLAMYPQILILDEPMAGLDPKGCSEVEQRIQEFHSQLGMTVIMISHDMHRISRIAEHLIVMNQGKVTADGTPEQVFENPHWLQTMGLELPPYMELMNRLSQKGWNVKRNTLNLNDTVEELKRILIEKKIQNKK